MKRFLALIASCFSIIAFGQGQSVKISGGPYLQNVTQNSFTVVWSTNMDAVGWVEIAPDDGTHFYNRPRQAFYDVRNLGRMPIRTTHKVTVTGLEPGTSYRYRVMMKGVENADNRRSITYTAGYGMDILKHKPAVCTTLSPEYDEVNFAVVNDIHENDSTFRELFKDGADDFNFVFFNGDMTSTIDNGEDIMKYYMNSASELFATRTPIYFSRGNHEYRGNDADKIADYYDFPTGKTYYTFQYGKYFFIVLDGGEDKPDSDIRNLGIMVTEPYVQEEAEWLKGIIASDDFKNAEVRIVFCHMQPNPDGWAGNARISRLLVPILNDGGIDLMLSGHIHRYHYYEPGATTAKFPVLCNANLQRLECHATSDKIEIRTFDAAGKQTHSIDFKTKQYR